LIHNTPPFFDQLNGDRTSINGSSSSELVHPRVPVRAAGVVADATSELSAAQAGMIDGK
jgi:hypothetical protein